MEQVSDIVLFQRIRQDDRLALNTLFAAYYLQLCRFACTFSLTYEQAEEAVSDVFFTIWKNRDRIEIQSNAKAYLFRCVKNAALATVRQNNSHTELILEQDSIDTVTPQVELEYQELTDQLNRVVDRLPQRCRQVFMMNRFEGLKYKEISSILGLSEKTIEHHMVKALDIVRAAFSVRHNRDSVHNSITLS